MACGLDLDLKRRYRRPGAFVGRALCDPDQAQTTGLSTDTATTKPSETWAIKMNPSMRTPINGPARIHAQF